MINCSTIVNVIFDFRFKAQSNVKYCIRMMMSWITLYANWTYDPYMVVRAQMFQESNIPQGFE